MLIHGYEFEFSSLNADDIERLEAANARYQQEAQAELKRSEREHLSYADGLRCQCRVIMNFLDEVFGSGASEKLGLDGSDFGKAIRILTEVKDAVAAEKQALQDIVAAPQNREQRRIQKRNEKHLKASRPVPAVPFPDPKAQMSATIATPKAPAAEMVSRVDKQTRRKQLLKELAALEND